MRVLVRRSCPSPVGGEFVVARLGPGELGGVAVGVGGGGGDDRSTGRYGKERRPEAGAPPLPGVGGVPSVRLSFAVVVGRRCCYRLQWRRRTPAGTSCSGCCLASGDRGVVVGDRGRSEDREIPGGRWRRRPVSLASLAVTKSLPSFPASARRSEDGVPEHGGATAIHSPSSPLKATVFSSLTVPPTRLVAFKGVTSKIPSRPLPRLSLPFSVVPIRLPWMTLLVVAGPLKGSLRQSLRAVTRDKRFGAGPVHRSRC